MAFEGLTERLSSAFKRLRSKGKLSDKDVKDAMREVRLALLEADVNYAVAKEFTERLTERAVGEEVMRSLTPAQMVVKLVHEELVLLMGAQQRGLDLTGKMPAVVMMCGLQGAGKTTHCAKLAAIQKRKGHRPLLVACDIYRPAAIKQLQVIGEKAGVPVFEKGTQNAVTTAKEALRFAKDYGHDLIILDTAGRLHVDNELMVELEEIKREISPVEILLVVDAMTGQDAVNVAKTFNERLEVTGVVLTKLDGDTRGGAALSVRKITGKPIKFVGTGEKLEDLEEFFPDRMASRILGMGDVMGLIEQAQSQMDDEKTEQMARRLMKNKFDLEDLLVQMQQIKKMGSMKSLLSKIPGLGGKISAEDIDERQGERMCAIILSMTPKERQKPEILAASRKKRIARGAGLRVEDVNALLKRFEQMQKLMKQFTGKGFGKFPRIGGF